MLIYLMFLVSLNESCPVFPRFRLRGVSGVRIVDASIMPNVVNGNTMAASIMIGEKGADLIKEDWGYPVDDLLWIV